MGGGANLRPQRISFRPLADFLATLCLRAARTAGTVSGSSLETDIVVLRCCQVVRWRKKCGTEWWKEVVERSGGGCALWRG